MSLGSPSEQNASLSGRESQPSSDRSSNSKGGSKWMGCLLGFFGAITVLVLLGAAFIIFFFVVVMGATAVEPAARAGLSLQELTVSGRAGNQKVVIVPVRGMLMRGGRLDKDPLALLRAMLEKARGDEQVRGVILSVDSGGGGITTCDIMRKAITDYRNQTGNPVVTLMGDVAASGAYYVSCGTDYIIAHPTTLTGSIGVLFPLYDASGLLGKVGVEDRTVKSGKYKDMTSPFAERTPEEREEQQKVLSGVVEQMHERFVSVVARGRNLDPEIVRKLADGRIYTSQDAQRFKLIDAVGYDDDAVAKVREMTGLAEVHVVEYRRTPTLKDLLLSHAGERKVTVQIGSGPGVTYKKPMYRWDPSAR